MKLQQITEELEKWAPLPLQESYDNSGLIVGDGSNEVAKAIVSLDCTEEVVQEAIDNGAQLVIAHHPIVFSGLKRFNGKNYVERTIMKAIKNDIAIYAIHTNLDNVTDGVNHHFANLLGLENQRILAPKGEQYLKWVVFVPKNDAEKVRSAMFQAGAGAVGDYDECSFNLEGEGTFRAGEGTNPHVGSIGERHTEEEIRVEMISERWKRSAIERAMIAAHPYEEVAFNLYALENKARNIGSGMIGELNEPMPFERFLKHLKESLDLPVIKYTRPSSDTVKSVAICGGSGFFLLNAAKGAKADVYITSDIKYHQFFDAEGKISLMDIGHWESERKTSELIVDRLKHIFPTFAVHLSEINTNPVNYY